MVLWKSVGCTCFSLGEFMQDVEFSYARLPNALQYGQDTASASCTTNEHLLFNYPIGLSRQLIAALGQVLILLIERQKSLMRRRDYFLLFLFICIHHFIQIRSRGPDSDSVSLKPLKVRILHGSIATLS